MQGEGCQGARVRVCTHTVTLIPLKGAVTHNYSYRCYLRRRMSLPSSTHIPSQMHTFGGTNTSQDLQTHVPLRGRIHTGPPHFRRHLCGAMRSFSGGHLLLPTHEHTSARHPPGEPPEPQSSPVSTFYGTANRLRRPWRENRSPAP